MEQKESAGLSKACGHQGTIWISFCCLQLISKYLVECCSPRVQMFAHSYGRNCNTQLEVYMIMLYCLQIR